MWVTHFADSAVRAYQREWLGPTSRRDVSGAQMLNAIRKIHVVAPALRSKSSLVSSIACIVTATRLSRTSLPDRRAVI